MGIKKFLKSIIIKLYTRFIIKRKIIKDKILFYGLHSYEKYTIDSVHSYCEKNSIPIEILHPQIEAEVYKPVCFGKSVTDSVIKEKVPLIYKTMLKDVLIFGGNDHIVVQKSLLNDKIDLKRAKSYDFARGCCIKFDLEQKKAICSVEKKITYIKEGINMYGQCSMNWYHWMIDILSRIVYINRFPELKDCPLLVDESTIRNESFLEALRVFDKMKHPIMILKSDGSYIINTLHYFSPTSFGNAFELFEYVPKEQRFLWCVKNQEVLEFYRQQGLEYAKDTKSPVGKLLFIDRGNALNGHRLKNENEIAAMCEKYGYMRFNPSEYSLKEQIAAYREAAIIIGDEGAAFTNAIYGTSKCIFAIILPQIWNNYVFSTLIHSVGNTCEYLDATLTGNDREHIIDIKYFENFLKAKAIEL